MLSSTAGWAVCADAPGPLVVSGETCTDVGEFRTSTADGQHAVTVTDAEYVGTDVTIKTEGADAYGVSATGASKVQLTGGSVTTEAGGSNAIFIDGAEASLDGVDVLTQAANSSGLVVHNAGKLTGQDITIETTADNGSHGIQIRHNSTVTLSGGTLKLSGDDSYGIDILEGSGTFDAKNFSVVTDGHAADAISLKGNGANVLLEDVQLVTNGSSARGIRLQEGSKVVGSAVTIETTQTKVPGVGGASHGVSVESNSTATLTSSKIAVAGPGSTGVEAITGGTFHGTDMEISVISADAISNVAYASEAGSVTLIDSFASTKGDNTIAFIADSSGYILLDNVDTTTSGDRATGVLTTGADSKAELKNGTVITTSGTDAHGLQVSGGGTIRATDTTVTVTGDGASAIVFEDSGASDDGLISVTGGSLKADQGPLIRVENGDGSIVLKGTIDLSPGSVGGRSIFAAISGNATDLDFTLDGITSATGDVDVTGAGSIVSASLTDSTWVGNLLVDAGNTVNLDLSGSEWKGRTTNATGITLDTTSKWTVTGSSNAGTIDNAGFITFDPAAGTAPTLTVNNYDGRNARLGINTVLGTDNSATNRLIVDGGKAEGTTELIVTNAGGGGALTTGDGIRVVKKNDQQRDV